MFFTNKLNSIINIEQFKEKVIFYGKVKNFSHYHHLTQCIPPIKNEKLI